MKVVCLAGPSDSGKTTLVERLVPLLQEAGDRVASVKSIHHDIEIDTPGADTHRHRTAGAETVVGITPALTFDISTRGKRNPPEVSDDAADSGPFANAGDGCEELDDTERTELQALEHTLTRLERRGYDVVLVEGFSAAPLPTIVVGEPGSASIGGDVVGTGDEDLDSLCETIRGLEEESFLDDGSRPNSSSKG
ncbi:molybdopterin-guanine dinucleotide biosynthesis protein B [Natrarchaeobaculum aegyptiacum]|uniref:Molybdopterin-guanine dinucleotide biosynthesis protein MobB n=1 Tax=Natrarchaeobaculum aegyptiacum TaxID=745377 RepID=A0A2Z2HVX6_9EURY|nr:molybdopterin-guanine dinucleotide biosynthesis protein MobB [Natrarchaeobaculum aegyptiacum]ARS91372.1 molybdopterin-guanine dinucleotide biosynthesis protein MobB [Natrarchaeobaculum aegyptiacum]